MDKNISLFDQRGQQVTHQTNIAIGNTIAEVADRESLIQALEALQQDGQRAYASDDLPLENWSEAKQNLELAKAEVETPKPDKSKLAGYLDAAKNAVRNVVAVAGLYDAITKLAEKIPHLPF